MTHHLWQTRSLNMTGDVRKKTHIKISAKQTDTVFQKTMAGHLTRLAKLPIQTVYPLAAMYESMVSNSSCHECEKQSCQVFLIYRTPTSSNIFTPDTKKQIRLHRLVESAIYLAGRNTTYAHSNSYSIANTSLKFIIKIYNSGYPY